MRNLPKKHTGFLLKSVNSTRLQVRQMRIKNAWRNHLRLTPSFFDNFLAVRHTIYYNNDILLP